MKKFELITPGEILSEEFLKPVYGASIDGRQICRYASDKVTLSIEVVVKSAKSCNVSVDHLLFENA
jgi:plasmid maintenance system antidote protein VapI